MIGGSGRRLTVLLTGGTGFIGGYIARRLAARGHGIRGLAREPSRAEVLREVEADIVRGDITENGALDEAAAGCDVAIHVVGIIRERPPAVTFEAVHTRGTLRVLEASQRAGIGKFVHMSALGAKPGGTAYQRTKYEAEELVRRSGLPYAIFRPSLNVGSGGEFTELLLRVLRFSPLTPVIGDGRYRLQPVDVEDVAQAFVQAAERDDLRDEVYEIGGPHKLTYNRMLEIVCEEFGLRRRRIHVPLGLVRPLVELASNWRLPTPINRDELAMLFEESIVPGEKSTLRDVFGLEPTPLRAVLQRHPRARASRTPDP
jgi:NADH dehydrogenase